MQEILRIGEQLARNEMMLNRLERNADFLFEQQRRNDYNEYLKHVGEWDNETMSYTEFKRKWRK